MFGPSPVPLGLSGGGVVGCPAPTGWRGEAMDIVQLFSNVKRLILLTCGNNWHCGEQPVACPGSSKAQPQELGGGGGKSIPSRAFLLTRVSFCVSACI